MGVPLAPSHLVAMRHGETDWNASRTVQGHDDRSRLSEVGKEQARAAGQELAGRGIDLIVSSDLTRATETARIVADVLGGCEVVIDPLLRERSYGTFEGRPTSDLTPEEIGFADGRVLDATSRPGGGESLDDLATRARQFLESLEHRWPERHILAVTHGGTIRALRAVVAGRAMSDIEWDTVTNCSIWEIE